MSLAPFNLTTEKWWLWLTRQEWQALYALSVALEIVGEKEIRPIPLGMLDAALELSDRGYEFEGISIEYGGVFFPKTEEPISPDNLVFLVIIYLAHKTRTDPRKFSAPQYFVHLEAAERFFSETFNDPELLNVIRAALDDFERQAMIAGRYFKELSHEEQETLLEQGRKEIEHQAKMMALAPTAVDTMLKEELKH